MTTNRLDESSSVHARGQLFQVDFLRDTVAQPLDQLDVDVRLQQRRRYLVQQLLEDLGRGAYACVDWTKKKINQVNWARTSSSIIVALVIERSAPVSLEPSSANTIFRAALGETGKRPHFFHTLECRAQTSCFWHKNKTKTRARGSERERESKKWGGVDERCKLTIRRRDQTGKKKRKKG